MNVKIIADSASDLPLDEFKSLNIEFLPLSVLIDKNEFFDLEQIKPSELYQSMREGKQPTTSQVSPARFKALFEKLAAEGTPSIYLAFSSELSGTYQSAVMMQKEIAEQYPDFDLTVIDTKCVSLGLGLIVKQAGEMALRGASKQEIIEMVNLQSKRMEHLFTVDDLEYLFRGGRISKASAFVGSLLKIKPLLNVEDGKLIPIEKIRGRKKVLKRMIELMKERGQNLNEQTVAISHADDEETALILKEMIQETFGCKDVYISSIGAVIGAHVGPGTLSVFFLND